MRTALGAALAVYFLSTACGISVAQEMDQAAGGEYADYSADAGVPAAPTRRPLRPIPGYPRGGALPPGETYGGSPGVYPQQSGPGYPTSRSYYEYSPSAPRPDSYGRMRSSGPDIDVRGSRMGEDWYRNMPAPNYDYRSRRY